VSVWQHCKAVEGKLLLTFAGQYGWFEMVGIIRIEPVQMFQIQIEF